MRVCIFRSDKPREHILAEALEAGVKSHGDSCEMRPLTGEAQVAEGCDIAAMVGVKSKRLFDANWHAGVHTLMFDKGYDRTQIQPTGIWKYWRVAIDGHHPTHYLSRLDYGPERWNRLGLTMEPWRFDGNKIIFAGSSEKYHDFYNMENPTDFAQKYITRIRKLNLKKTIVYRPKPSWHEAVPIHGTVFSQEGPIEELLKGAFALITHGSNAVWEAIHAGVPTVVLGDAVSRSISSTECEHLRNPLLVSDRKRLKWASNLAYCQWTIAELRSGEAWKHIKEQFYSHCV